MNQLTFTLYRFSGKSTVIVRDHTIADGMRTLVPADTDSVQETNNRVREWATSHSLGIIAHEPYPSTKHPGMVWMDYRFGGLVL